MLIAAALILGLCLGSFVNAVVWRLHEQARELQATSKKLKVKKPSAKDLSILKGRSMCPHCRHVLAWHDLVPLLSWLALRGKCRYCSRPISRQYPLIETVVAFLVVISVLNWAFIDAADYAKFIFWLIYIVLLVSLAVYDLRWLILPNKLTYPLFWLAVLEAFLVAFIKGDIYPVIFAAQGLLVLGGSMAALFYVSNGKWLGGGDVKLASFMGLFLGWQKGLLAIMLASYIGVAIFMVLMIIKRINRRQPIAFGPLLIIATIFTYFGGDTIIAAYRSIVGI